MSLPYLFGIHSVKARLIKQPHTAKTLYVLEGREDKALKSILTLAQEIRLPIRTVSRETLNHMAQQENHQGVLLEVDSTASPSPHLKDFLKGLKKPALLLVLDGIQDPHNLGACFRSADAAGVDAIIAPKDNATSITPIVSKVASGAAETIPFFQVTNLARTLELLKEEGIWIYGMTEEASSSLYQMNFTGPIALVLGAEGKGLRNLTKTKCDELISLPMAGTVSSLNVSVATGVALFEVVRQRQR